jgi:MtN3 and saliva related transmembrane protein
VKAALAKSDSARVSFSPLGMALWLAYGLALGDWPLIGSSGVTLVLMLPILGLKLRYG